MTSLISSWAKSDTKDIYPGSYKTNVDCINEEYVRQDKENQNRNLSEINQKIGSDKAVLMTEKQSYLVLTTLLNDNVSCPHHEKTYFQLAKKMPCSCFHYEVEPHRRHSD